MKKYTLMSFVIIPILSLGLLGMFGHFWADVIVQFENIDEADDKNLKLRFEIKDNRRKSGQIISPGGVTIRRNDSIVMTMRNDSNVYIDHWKFPSVPNGFTVTYPTNSDKLPIFYKTDNLDFSFETYTPKGRFSGRWTYKSNFSYEKHRWMFDDAGNQIYIISCRYEPWIGKDVVGISSNQLFHVCDSSFILSYIDDKPLDFTIRYKRNPTDRIVLTLNKKEKKGTKLIVRFKVDDNEYFDEILVPGRDIIGISGKYGGL